MTTFDFSEIKEYNKDKFTVESFIVDFSTIDFTQIKILKKDFIRLYYKELVEEFNITLPEKDYIMNMSRFEQFEQNINYIKGYYGRDSKTYNSILKDLDFYGKESDWLIKEAELHNKYKELNIEY